MVAREAAIGQFARKTSSLEALRIAESGISMLTTMKCTWLYSRYIDNSNKLNRFKLRNKNFKLEKLKFNSQIKCLSMKF